MFPCPMHPNGQLLPSRKQNSTLTFRRGDRLTPRLLGAIRRKFRLLGGVEPLQSVGFGSEGVPDVEEVVETSHGTSSAVSFAPVHRVLGPRCERMCQDTSQSFVEAASRTSAEMRAERWFARLEKWENWKVSQPLRGFPYKLSSN